MATFRELSDLRAWRVTEIELCGNELQELLDFPSDPDLPSYDIYLEILDKVKYRYDFILKDIKEIDFNIKNNINTDFRYRSALSADFDTAISQHARVSLLPKNHFSLFTQIDNPNFP